MFIVTFAVIHTCWAAFFPSACSVYVDIIVYLYVVYHASYFLFVCLLICLGPSFIGYTA